MKKNDNVSLSTGLATTGTCFKMSYETHHIYISSSEMQNIFEAQPSNDSLSKEDLQSSTDEDLLLPIA
jgi:hypothetical protein